MFILLFVLSILPSCNKDGLKNCEEQSVAECTQNPNKTNIRIKNNSEFNFCNVVLNPSNGNTNFGIIKSGETSCYKAFDLAYSYAFVQLYINDKEYTLQPIDYVGEQELGLGNFTYHIDILDIEERSLSINTTTD